MSDITLKPAQEPMNIRIPQSATLDSVAYKAISEGPKETMAIRAAATMQDNKKVNKDFYNKSSQIKIIKSIITL
jgi:hypothetical protein